MHNSVSAEASQSRLSVMASWPGSGSSTINPYPLTGGAAYAAAKHGVLGLTRSAALEHAKNGVRITAICPGWIGTPPVENFIKKNEKIGAQIIGQEPIGRLGTPAEVASGVLWLCAEAASFMLGSPLVLDGGYMA